MKSSAELSNLQKDYAREVFFDSSLLKEEISRLEGEIGVSSSKTSDLSFSLKEGISIIIPVYKSVNTIERTLNSLLSQTLDKSKFNAIVVLNGEDDGSAKIIETFIHDHKDLEIHFIRTNDSGAGLARNIAIRIADREYMTFLDADDEFEPRFLEVSFGHLNPINMVVNPIVDVSPEGVIESNTVLGERIRRLAGQSVPVHQVPWILGFNACKILPTKLLKRIRYNTSLESGEDLVFFALMLRHLRLTMVVPSDCENANYRRHITKTSVSRRSESFDFNVLQRLDCISELQKISVSGPQLVARKQLEAAQAGFISRYLEKNPEKTQQLLKEIGNRQIVDFPWKQINRGPVKQLAIAYCFAPYADTSAVMAAKAIDERHLLTDVISCDMSKVRKTDLKISFLADRWLNRKDVITSPVSFAGWDAISDFATKAVQVAEKNNAVNGGYEQMYTRALWIGSHVAGALFKLRHWNIRWSAEFSDPLRHGVTGEPRPGGLTDNEVSRSLIRGLEAKGIRVPEFESLFHLVELATLVFADEIIFTNENQLEYMLSEYDGKLRELVENKSVVRPHPIPPEEAYHAFESTYVLPSDKLNIGFFGSFYENRGLTELFTALANLPAKLRRIVRLHVFSNQPDAVSKNAALYGLQSTIYSNSYVPYMDFLNLITYFDVLMVNDAVVTGEQNINPFLPSKYSDYKGSGTNIWGLVDDGSPLSKMSLDYRSEAGNSASIHSTLLTICADYLES
ncbi:hypothetical protein BSR28_01965 [Boudabousia liubingyangii]|uniref:glycosyltransferase n=1 Tax=Boudabousia liubingyangii TaxID=1921764 RepID=UPI00093F1BF8|nr:glycosyltransferase [Boudabousia liubingyangii]OKL48484.1 hypothetical protein BSR28_01965 [Boudabousia liubingyangii]